MSILTKCLSTLTTCVLVACSDHAFAGIAFDLPFGHDQPEYFSGENCRLFTHTYVTGTTSHIARIKLSVNGKQMRDDVFSPLVGPHGTVYYSDDVKSYMFNSFQFSFASLAEVTLEAWDLDSNHYFAHMYVPFKNYAALFERSEWNTSGDTDGIPPWESSMLGLECPWYTETSQGWSSWDFYGNACEDKNIIYVCSHGNTWDEDGFSYMISDYDALYPRPNPMTESYADKLYIWSDPSNTGGWDALTTVLETRQAAIGSGYPPFNSSAIPPVTLAFDDSCKCGVNDDPWWMIDASNFADAFLWPYWTAMGIGRSARATLGGAFLPTQIRRDRFRKNSCIG